MAVGFPFAPRAGRDVEREVSSAGGRHDRDACRYRCRNRSGQGLHQRGCRCRVTAVAAPDDGSGHRVGQLSWSGHYLVDPWDADGQLVDLDALPRLRAYFQRHAALLKQRHVAGKRPAQWYRTIDKVDHSLINRPKLLIPDMKTTIHPVLDDGGHYPHHNLYYIVSDVWDLRVLGGLLLSRVAQAFVEAYAVRMRGGTLRFQAQYLRRIRVPRPETISARDAAALASAFRDRDARMATEVALRVYGIEDQRCLFDGPAAVRGGDPEVLGGS